MATTAPEPHANADAADNERLRAQLEESAREKAELLIEIRRLRGQAAERTAVAAERDDALAQQAATAEVLRAIASSATDLRAVFRAMAESAVRLCGAEGAAVFRCAGGGVRQEVLVGPMRAHAERYRAQVALGQAAPLPTLDLHAGRTDWAVARALQTAHPVEIEDVLDPRHADLSASRGAAQVFGWRATLVVPLLREGAAVGAISVYTAHPRAFTERETALLRTFADQAVIAIENARLFSELQESNTTLREALEQQTATSDILRAIAASPADVGAVLGAIAETAARLCGAEDATVAQVIGDQLVKVANYGTMPGAPIGRARPVPTALPEGLSDRAVFTGRTVHVPDWADEPESGAKRAQLEGAGARAGVAAPLLRQGRAVGALHIRRREPGPFTEQQIRLLESFADQAVIAIENARLFNELQESNATLKEALEQQTATADILRVIARSPGDLQGVLDTIVETACRICGAYFGAVFRELGGALVPEGAYGIDPAGIEALHANPIRTRNPTTAGGRAYAERRPVMIPDVLADPGYRYGPQTTLGYRSILGVPLLRDEAVIGVLSLGRSDVRPFTDAEVTLVQSFADQAVVAIENTRLFTELQERDARRRQELERASAIQQRLLPSQVEGWPGMLEIAHRFRPAVETSGDFYDVLPLTPARLGEPAPLQVAVGDVAGKGMSAALVTALARSALRASASAPTEMVTPAGTLRLAGRRLNADVGSGHFVACALAVVEPPGRHNRGPLLRLANAAQVPVLLVRDGMAREIEPPGYRLPLGAEDDGAYRDAEMELRPGDAVVFSSDGLVEAPSLSTPSLPEHLPAPEGTGELFGFARLAASASHWSVCAPTAEAVAAGIWSDLTAWCGEESHHDDMTLLVLRVVTP